MTSGDDVMVTLAKTNAQLASSYSVLIAQISMLREEQARTNAILAELQKAQLLPPHTSQALQSGKPLSMLAQTNGSESTYAGALRNGKYLVFAFPHKSGSTEWQALLLRHLSGNATIAAPHMFMRTLWRTNSLSRYVPLSAVPAAATVVRICITRNPYERMLSFYLDKVVGHRFAEQKEWLQMSQPLLPPGVARNSTFEKFVRLASEPRCLGNGRTREPCYRSALAAQHYGPISLVYPLCRDPRTRTLKLEEMDNWYAELVRELGWEDTVATGWRSKNRADSCFYHRPGLTCEQELRTGQPPPPPPQRQQRPQMEHNDEQAGTERCPPREDRTAHSSGACMQMRQYYTSQIAKLVSRFASDDLERFGYPRWEGGDAPWS